MKYVVLILGLALSGCYPPGSDQDNSSPFEPEYVRDDRTGLCFARTGNWNSWAPEPRSRTLAHVPCTPELTKLLTN